MMLAAIVLYVAICYTMFILFVVVSDIRPDINSRLCFIVYLIFSPLLITGVLMIGLVCLIYEGLKFLLGRE